MKRICCSISPLSLIVRKVGRRVDFAVLLLGLLVLLPAARTADGQELSAVATVERQEAFVGESLIFRVEVRGDDSPAEPDLSALTDFDVKPLGGQTRNTESITIINGQMSRVVRRGYVFSYRLTPNKAGQLVIPPVEVEAAGKKLRTEPLVLQVNEPAETDDFKLRLVLSKRRCYVGEHVTLTVTWYLSKDVRGFEFTLPVLSDERFNFHDPEVEIDRAEKYYRVPLAGGEVVARRGQGDLDGRTYTTLSFRKVVVPTVPGAFDVPAATVAFEALMGYRKSRDPFDDFFSDDFFGAGRRGVYQRFVARSNSPPLQVAPLPEEGRPESFAGHVGRFHIEASATPTEANVGDPITLTIRLSGPEYLGDVELPPLNDQPALAGDFKIPEEMAPGKVEGKVKVFTQTIRATHAAVKQIPPIELPYFDTETGRYSVARTRAIPVTIHSTRVVTVQDAEGREPSPVRSELTEWSKGIAHNYEDLSVLRNQAYGLATLLQSPFWMASTLGPLGIYLVLLVTTVAVRRARAEPERRRARKAYGELRKGLKKLKAHEDRARVCGEVLESFQHYLGKKLRLTSRAITYRDVEAALKARGVAADALEELKKLFEECEATHYAAGSGAAGDAASIRSRALGLAKRVECSLK